MPSAGKARKIPVAKRWSAHAQAASQAHLVRPIAVIVLRRQSSAASLSPPNSLDGPRSRVQGADAPPASRGFAPPPTCGTAAVNAWITAQVHVHALIPHSTESRSHQRFGAVDCD
jgi:hypothetical protein